MKPELEDSDLDIAQLAYRRLKRRLNDLAISPSVGSIHFREELRSFSSSSSPTSFIPFLRERSATGKLLTAVTSSPTAFSPIKHRSISVQRRGVMRTHAARLKKQPEKCGTPGVGAYGVKYPWESKPVYLPRKRDFSPITVFPRKSKPFRPSSHPISTPISPISLPTPQPHRPKPIIHDKFDGLRPEVMLKQVKKTNFQSVKLQGSPQDLIDSLQIQERRRLKEEKLFVVKRLMRRMLKGKFY